MLRWMLLGGRVGLGRVIRPRLRSALFISPLTSFHRPPCSRTTCLLDIAWLGNLAGQGAVLDAGVHAFFIGAYMVALAVVLALHDDTHVSRHDQPCHHGWLSWRQNILLAPCGDCLP